MISIIIPALDCEDDLRDLLGDIGRTKLPDYEVLVVDDGSTDGTAAAAGGFPKTRAISLGRNRGPSRARNVGASEARGEVLIFMDSDIRLPGDRDVLLAMAEAFEDPGLDCAISVSDPKPLRESAIAYAGSIYHAYYMERFLGGKEERRGRIMFFTTRLGAVRASKFRESGGFYDSLWTVMNEDGEFGSRVYHMGVRTLLRADFGHSHRYPVSWRRWAKSYFLTALVQAQVGRKYDTSADESVSGAERFRRLWACAAFALPLLPWPAAAVWAAVFLASFGRLNTLVWREVPARYRAQWYALYVLITPVILAGFAAGLAQALAGRSLLRGRPSDLECFERSGAGTS